MLLQPAGPTPKKLVTDWDEGRDITDLNPSSSPRTYHLITKPPNEDPQPEEQRSPSLEDIDSFTLDVCDPQVLSKAKRNKRQTPSRETRQSPQKKRRLAQTAQMCSPQASPVISAAELSPISSFSRSIDPASVRPSLQNGASVALPKNNQLDLRPFNEVPLVRQPPKTRTKTSKAASGPPTSPIEDPSIVVSQPALHNSMKPLAPESSKLYLEVKERIAKHTTLKHRDKVLKLGSKSVFREPSTSKAPADAFEESSIIYVSSSPSSRASSPDPPERSIAKQEKMKERKPAVEKRKPKGRKEKPPPMTPAAYASMLQAKTIAASNLQDSSTSNPLQKRKHSSVKFLKGKNIFYTGGDMRHASETTRGRMDIIVRYGGNLMPEFKPDVTTHIITEAHVTPTLRALGLNRLKDIPDHIPTVKWSWLLSVLGHETVLSQEEIDEKLSNVWMNAAFLERMDAGCKPQIPRSAPPLRGKGKERVKDEMQQLRDPVISNTDSFAPRVQHTLSSSPGDRVNRGLPEFRHHPGALVSPPTSPFRPLDPQPSSSRINTSRVSASTGEKETDATEDPLAEFYDQARAQRNEEGWSSLGELDMEGSDGDETDDEPPEALHVPRQKRAWTCDNKEPQLTKRCPNQDIIDKLTELMDLHKSKMGDEDHWRAFSYSKCIRALRNYPRRIKTFEEARNIRGVGEKTARKIEEILQTGQLRRISYEKTKDVEVTRLFQGIYGVGQSIAFQWYSAGCRTLQDLKDGKGGVKLTAVQEIGLRYYDDINNRMPRAEAKEIFDLIKPIALSIDSKLFIEIMGSYRRGKADCGDIDILITRPVDDGLTHRGVLPRLLRELHSVGILTEDLAHPDDPNDLEATYRGLCRLPNIDGSRRRRIDFLSVPWASRGGALLYYTGDDIFNRAIRLKANVLGYSLNQRGLFGNVVRDPRDRRVKMNSGVLVASETEEEIFKILGVPWQEPHERVRG
ncbi:hypothetical protein GALMADRAFT_1309526 [Galerina marginata CBS 339.88]|uniref:DNA polymerase lambda n=1 Tax=Galerina marginata (strain CBS 339.88) TaxID=685588 RepID=A0A067T527_GALM3|nr:hypothetical protein GALMADRAFT_1309526 [Galerina marginata CBS 339.88]